MPAAVNHYADVAVFRLFSDSGVPQFHNQITAAAIDNVFAFAPVKMHGCHLAIADVHDFFGVAFLIGHAFW
ncbi:hypothetical protein D3C81_2153080 [compost metagenome]